MTEEKVDVIEAETLPALTAPNQVQLAERSVEDVVGRVVKVQHLMKTVLLEGEHFGVIPGTKKPTLYQPGAQLLGFMFKLAPSFIIDTVNLDGGHREHTVTCSLTCGAVFVAEGVGSCSSMESKYRWRKGGRVCPACRAGTIKRSTFGNKGWYCFAKIGGCGAKFEPEAEEITSQEGDEGGRQENPDIADVYNTVLKMAKKRAFVDATLTATAASNIFTQDLEDMPSVQREPKRGRSDSPGLTTNERNCSFPRYGADDVPPEDNPTGSEEPDIPLPAKISSKEKQNIWAVASNRAEEVGATNEQIVRDVLVRMGVERTGDLTDYEKAMRLVESWEPNMTDAEFEGGAK